MRRPNDLFFAAAAWLPIALFWPRPTVWPGTRSCKSTLIILPRTFNQLLIFFLDSIGVRLGEHNLGTEKDCEFLGGRIEHCLPPYEEYGLEDVRPHPNYKSINNDIALIKLDRPVQFKGHIMPICLPIDRKSQDISYDQSFFISGWGRTENNEPSSVLLKAVVRRQNHNVCRNFYADAYLNENHICAVGENIVHTCPGDSGGPLFFRNPFKNTTRYIQYGIVSYGGKRCGQRQNQPGVFASVLDMLPWITQNLYWRPQSDLCVCNLFSLLFMS